jgi:hypothetical protein
MRFDLESDQMGIMGPSEWFMEKCRLKKSTQDDEDGSNIEVKRNYGAYSEAEGLNVDGGAATAM